MTSIDVNSPGRQLTRPVRTRVETAVVEPVVDTHVCWSSSLWALGDCNSRFNCTISAWSSALVVSDLFSWGVSSLTSFRRSMCSLKRLKHECAAASLAWTPPFVQFRMLKIEKSQKTRFEISERFVVTIKTTIFFVVSINEIHLEKKIAFFRVHILP